MKKFVFSLQALQTMKENSEKMQKTQLKSIEAKLLVHEQEIKKLLEKYENIKLEFNNAAAKGIEAARAMHFGEFFLKLKAAIVQNEKSAAMLEQEKEDCLKKLVNIRKEKMVIEKLRNKEYEEYLCEVKKEQSKVAEDFYSYKVSVS